MRLRCAVLVVVALAVIPSLAALRSRAFFSPDETLHAEVAREMRETGDLVVPRFDGRPFLYKPPLTYWLLAGTFALVGWGLPAAVLLNTALTAGTALLLLLHVRRTTSARAGLLAAAAYLTMLLPTALARTALTDPALTLCTTGAVVAFFAARPAGALLAGALLGLGTLDKGPVAALVVLPALAAVLVVRRDRRSLVDTALAITVAAAVALPWHLALASRGLFADYVNVFFEREIVSRVVDAWPQQQPWWYYLPVAWAAAFPWGTHIALAARRWWRHLRSGSARDPIPIAEAAAAVVPLVAFSLAKNKLPHYLLPMLPWLAAWLGRAADRVLDPGSAQRFAERLAPLAGLLAGAALTVLTVAISRSSYAQLVPRGTTTVLLAAGAAFVLLGLRARRFRPWAWGAAAALALLLHVGADAVVVPRLDACTVERPLAERVRDLLPAGGLPIAYRWFRPSLVAYGVRGWRIADTDDQLAAAMDAGEQGGRAVLVTTRAEYEGGARAVPWGRGGEARVLARVRGLGQIDGQIVEGVVFDAARRRDGRRWFYDADRPVPGEQGLTAVAGNPWTPSFRFSTSPEVVLVIPAHPGGPAVLRLRAWGLPDTDGEPQSIKLVLNDSDLGELVLDTRPSQFAVDVPATALARNRQVLLITNHHLVAPRLVDPGSDDQRELGFALDWLALEPAGATMDLVGEAVPGPA